MTSILIVQIYAKRLIICQKNYHTTLLLSLTQPRTYNLFVGTYCFRSSVCLAVFILHLI